MHSITEAHLNIMCLRELFEKVSNRLLNALPVLCVRSCKGYLHYCLEVELSFRMNPQII